MDEPKGIVVRHTADKMKAFVSLSGALGPFTAGAVLTELLHKGVVHGLKTAVIHKLISLSLFDKFVEVAAGTVASPGSDGRIEVLVRGYRAADAFAALILGKAARPRPLCEFLVVKAGMELVRRVPPVPGADGMDVFGTPIAASAVKDAALACGPGAAAKPGDPDTLVAAHDGVFKLQPDGTVEVCPYMEIAGDAAADVKFDGCLKVGGALRAGFSLEASGSLLIMGDVEDGASVKCGGDLSIRGNVHGSALSIVCGGNAQAAHLEGVNLTVEGNLTVSGDIVESVINAKGIVRARAILGGRVTSAGGIFAAQVGSENKQATVLDVGAAYGYVKDRDNAKSKINTQALLAEGYISELYCYVRDNMDDSGYIMPAAMAGYERYRSDLTDSLDERKNLEKEVEALEACLKEVAGCCITAGEIHPNVSIRLGHSEEQVRGEVLKNVCMKPVGIEG